MVLKNILGVYFDGVVSPVNEAAITDPTKTGHGKLPRLTGLEVIFWASSCSFLFLL